VFSGGNARALRRLALEAGGMRAGQTEVCRRAGVDLIDLTCGQDVVKPLMQFFRSREKRR